MSLCSLAAPGWADAGSAHYRERIVGCDLAGKYSVPSMCLSGPFGRGRVAVPSDPWWSLPQVVVWMSNRRHGLWLCDSEGPDISQGLAAGPPGWPDRPDPTVVPPGDNNPQLCGGALPRTQGSAKATLSACASGYVLPSSGGSGTREASRP